MGVSVYEQEKLLEERRQQLLNRYKRIEMEVYKWEAGLISAQRLAEIVFGIVNEEAQR